MRPWMAIKRTILTQRFRVSLCLRSDDGNRLYNALWEPAIVTQVHDTWYSLDMDFIHADVHGWLCNKPSLAIQMQERY